MSSTQTLSSGFFTWLEKIEMNALKVLVILFFFTISNQLIIKPFLSLVSSNSNRLVVVETPEGTVFVA